MNRIELRIARGVLWSFSPNRGLVPFLSGAAMRVYNEIYPNPVAEVSSYILLGIYCIALVASVYNEVAKQI